MTDQDVYSLALIMIAGGALALVTDRWFWRYLGYAMYGVGGLTLITLLVLEVTGA